MEQRIHQPLTTNVLGSLRALIPAGRVGFEEAQRIAERQAKRLLGLYNVTRGAVSTDIISNLPKIRVESNGRLVWGATFWDVRRQTWVIQLPSAEPPAHNRFTLAHEFKHIIDHGRQTVLYCGTPNTDPEAEAEQAADYFAGCLLVPRSLLKAAWDSGIQTTGELAERFEVSENTIGVRLRQTGLADDHRLRHLPSPLPFVADDEVDTPGELEPPEQNKEGVLAE